MDKSLIKFVLDEKEIAKRLEFQEEVIAELSNKYMAITVKGVDDEEGYKAAHAARMDMVHKRTDFTKRSKAFRDELNEYPKMELKVEKHILSLLAPIEEHLLSQEKIVDDEKARIKAEADAKEAARIQARVDKLYSMGLISRNGNFYLSFTAEGYVPEAIAKTCPDDEFNKLTDKFQQSIDAENARIEKEKAEKKAEEERLAKVKSEQEAEFKRLAAIAEEQAAKELKIKQEQEKIEREKQRLIDEDIARKKKIQDEKDKVEAEKKRKEELEKATKEAAEKALKDAEEKRIKEEKAKADKAERERIATEKKAARQPDKIKLLAFAEEFEKPVNPEMKTIEGKQILNTFNQRIEDALKDLREIVETL